MSFARPGDPAALRARDEGQLSQAALLAYATIERHVDLCLWYEHALDDEKPEYEKVREVVEQQRERYDELSRGLIENYTPRELRGAIYLSNGLPLLGVLSPERVDVNAFRPIRGLMHARNRCEFEHGLIPRPPSAKEVDNGIEAVKRMVARGPLPPPAAGTSGATSGSPGSGGEGGTADSSLLQRLDSLLEGFSFPRLEC